HIASQEELRSRHDLQAETAKMPGLGDPFARDFILDRRQVLLSRGIYEDDSRLSIHRRLWQHRELKVCQRCSFQVRERIKGREQAQSHGNCEVACRLQAIKRLYPCRRV